MQEARLPVGEEWGDSPSSLDQSLPRRSVTKSWVDLLQANRARQSLLRHLHISMPATSPSLPARARSGCGVRVTPATAPCFHGCAFHHRGIQLVLPICREHRAFTRVEQRIVFHDFDRCFNRGPAMSRPCLAQMPLPELLFQSRPIRCIGFLVIDFPLDHAGSPVQHDSPLLRSLGFAAVTEVPGSSIAPETNKPAKVNKVKARRDRLIPSSSAMRLSSKRLIGTCYVLGADSAIAALCEIQKQAGYSLRRKQVSLIASQRSLPSSALAFLPAFIYRV